jgi:hypothetical protein
MNQQLMLTRETVAVWCQTTIISASPVPGVYYTLPLVEIGLAIRLSARNAVFWLEPSRTRRSLWLPSELQMPSQFGSPIMRFVIVLLRHDSTFFVQKATVLLFPMPVGALLGHVNGAQALEA